VGQPSPVRLMRSDWIIFRRLLVLALAATLGATATLDAQTAPPAVTQVPEDDPDLDPNPAQPDFTVINLPTTLRLPRHKSAFRVTHRFARPLGSGDFGSLVEDFFGLDSGAQIGLEYRFGLFRKTQIGIHRTSDRTIELFGQYDVIQQKDGGPLGLAVFASVDGTNNFRDSYTPGIGVIVSREFGEHGAAYAMPMYLNNTNVLPALPDEDNDTMLVALGLRFRARPTVYLLAEYTPRAAGYMPREHLASFGIEKRAGGHSFQLNFSNGFGTTMGQIARGGISNDDWFLGFNISRKFF
jgi:hypothetical protein